MSADIYNAVHSITMDFLPLPNPVQARTLFVMPDSTGTVMHQTWCIENGEGFWCDVESYEAGSGDVLNQGMHIFRFVPSDATTRYKYW